MPNSWIGNRTISVGFLPANVDYDGAYWGIEPELTTPYGQYNNGKRVFNTQTAFGSLAALPLGFSTPTFPGYRSNVIFNTNYTMVSPSDRYNDSLFYDTNLQSQNAAES